MRGNRLSEECTRMAHACRCEVYRGRRSDNDAPERTVNNDLARTSNSEENIGLGTRRRDSASERESILEVNENRPLAIVDG